MPNLFLNSIFAVSLFIILSVVSAHAQAVNVPQAILKFNTDLLDAFLKSNLKDDKEVNKRIEIYMDLTTRLAENIRNNDQFNSDYAIEFLNDSYNKTLSYKNEAIDSLIYNNRSYFEKKFTLNTLDIKLFLKAIIKPLFGSRILFKKIGIVVGVQKKVGDQWLYGQGFRIFEVSNNNFNSSLSYDNNADMQVGEKFVHFIVFPGVHFFWAELQGYSKPKIFDYDGKPAVKIIDYIKNSRKIIIKCKID